MNNNRFMNMTLIFPPQGDPTMPAQSMAVLKAWVENKLPGYQVRCIDANVESYDYLLSPSILKNFAERVHNERMRLEKEAELEGHRLVYYRALSRADLVAPGISEAVDEAKAILRDPERFHDHASYRWASTVICRSLDLISCTHYPTQLEIGSFSTPYSTERLSHILACAGDTRFNPFMPYYQNVLLPRLETLKSGVIGLSLAYPTQIHQVFFLAAALRKMLPGTRIVLGGSMLPTLIYGIRSNPGFLENFDAVLAFEGERSLVELLQAFCENKPWDRTPGLISTAGGKVRVNPPAMVADLGELPPPDFSDYPLHLYLSPHPVMPFSLGRGCYWGKCTFCCQDETSRELPRRKPIKKIREELLDGWERFNFRYVYMSDEGFDPEHLASLGDIIYTEGLNIKWSSDARFDGRWNATRFLRASRGGCIKLWFGLESYNNRTLHRMGKGISVARVRHILELCNDSGILVHLYCMFGFPGETIEEALNTLNFILENRSRLDTVAINSFRLHHSSPIFNNPEHYGVAILGDESGRDLPHDQPFESLNGMSVSEVESMCADVKASPAIEVLLAPYVLSKAHMLILASRNLDYRTSIAKATGKCSRSSVDIAKTASDGKLRKIQALNIQRFSTPIFEGEEADGNSYIYLYEVAGNRILRISEQMAAVLAAFGEGATTEAVAGQLGTDVKVVFKEWALPLIRAGLLEKIPIQI